MRDDILYGAGTSVKTIRLFVHDLISSLHLQVPVMLGDTVDRDGRRYRVDKQHLMERLYLDIPERCLNWQHGMDFQIHAIDSTRRPPCP